MPSRTATCPNCGADITFLWSSAVQTTCPACRSILVRHDVDLEKVGVVGDVPPTATALQIGTEGRYQGTTFVVVGRIVYEYQRGRWSEWHLRMGDDTSAWLSDAQGEYAFTRQLAPDAPLPADVAVGQRFAFDGTSFEVTSVTTAHYAGVEGELPFEYWDKTDVRFADLESDGNRFATLDYSGAEPLLFVGEYAEFDDLAMRNLREFEGW